jgi:cytochrome o ubiquinol oxidase subunit 2
MPSSKIIRRLLLAPALAVAALMSGCNTVLMNASGHVAIQQGNLIVISTVLMLLIIVPVIVLIVLFAYKYRQSNTEAVYEPDWDHSTQLELVIWAAPLLIIIALGAVTWISTHTLDPYRPLTRIDDTRNVATGTKPLLVEVVALDWKWLFIYPEQGIALVNELAAPVDRPIEFKITSSSVMNSFFIPALAGQIYAMPSMMTTLHAVINKPGVFDGFSANYSGAGFSGMRFKFHGMAAADFDRWVQTNKDSKTALNREVYLKLEAPSERVPVRRYGQVEAGLFDAVVNRCVEAGKMCMSQMSSIDSRGGMGMGGTTNMATVTLASATGSTKRSYVEAMCSVDNPMGRPLAPAQEQPVQ